MSDEDRSDETPEPRPLGAWIPDGAIFDGSAILDRFLAWVAHTGIEPYPAQEEALLELMSGRHVILSTPTGSGKSLVALGLHFKAMCEGKRSFYTAPIKALASEKFFDLCRAFGPENVGMLTGDASINWSAPVICCTAEVLSNMTLSQGAATDAPYVVMDEFHYYSDRDRGSAWQIPLIRLPRTRFLLMSATLGDTRAIEREIEARTGQSVARVHSDERPVPLDFSYAETALHETVEKLLREDKAPIYIVQFTQRDAADQAQALTSANITNRDEKRAIAEAIAGFRFDSPYGKDIARFLRHGIGLHHAGLLPKYRLLVERLAQEGLLKVICGTDTLGVGVNVPIRSVLFTKLCKFDGEKVGILSVRDFKQIAGRAGRKGFDTRGSVVVQAPEHVIENLKLDAKARAAGPSGRKRFVRKKAPTRGYVAWNADTLERLQHDPPETLTSRFRVTHGLIVSCLQSAAGGDGGAGYRTLLQLIEDCHDTPVRKRGLRREAARLFRSLRHAEVVEIVRDEVTGRNTVRVERSLQSDFSLHQSLSLYLVDAVSALDPNDERYAVDVLSLAEAILENPRPILIGQEKNARGELVAALKAEGVPYEERMERLENVTWPKPNEELIYATFNLFAERHPWVGGENIRPKGIGREIFDDLATFDDYVKRMGLARVEGLLLRYLGQLHDTLARTLPAAARNEAVDEMIAFFRALVARVDSSLIEEWQSLVHPEPEAKRGDEPPPEYDLAADAAGLRARIRSELRVLLRALASRRYDDALDAIHPGGDPTWDAPALEREMSAFYEEFDYIVDDPRARQAHLCVVRQRAPRVWQVNQVLLDDSEENLWSIEGEVDLREEKNPPEPLLRLRRIGP